MAALAVGRATWYRLAISISVKGVPAGVLPVKICSRIARCNASISDGTRKVSTMASPLLRIGVRRQYSY